MGKKIGRERIGKKRVRQSEGKRESEREQKIDPIPPKIQRMYWSNKFKYLLTTVILVLSN